VVRDVPEARNLGRRRGAAPNPAGSSPRPREARDALLEEPTPARLDERREDPDRRPVEDLRVDDEGPLRRDRGEAPDVAGGDAPLAPAPDHLPARREARDELLRADRPTGKPSARTSSKPPATLNPGSPVQRAPRWSGDQAGHFSMREKSSQTLSAGAPTLPDEATTSVFHESTGTRPPRRRTPPPPSRPRSPRSSRGELPWRRRRPRGGGRGTREGRRLDGGSTSGPV